MPLILINPDSERFLSKCCLQLTFSRCLAASETAVSEAMQSFEENLKTYYELSDKTWRAGGSRHQDKLITRSQEIPPWYIQQHGGDGLGHAWRAAMQRGYFSPEEAVLAEWNQCIWKLAFAVAHRLCGAFHILFEGIVCFMRQGLSSPWSRPWYDSVYLCRCFAV